MTIDDREIEERVMQARALLAAHRFVEAERVYRAVLAERPQHAGALHGFGELAMFAGRYDDADAALRAALEQFPGNIDLMIDLAQCCYARNDLETAEVYARLAVFLNPSATAARLALVHVLEKCGHLSEGIPELLRVIEIEPQRSDVRLQLARAQLATSLHVATGIPSAKVRYRLGHELEKLGRRVDAAEYYRSALAQDPDLAIAAIDLAALHHQWEDLETSVELNNRALRIQPNSAQAHHNLALSLNGLKRYDEAMKHLNMAQALAPDTTLVGLNKAMLLLLLGRWEEGWEEYEWRWKLERRQRKPFAPPWDGSPLGGRTLLLFSEQGMGDTIQMSRYLELVAERVDYAAGGRILLGCPEPLQRLLSHIPGVDLPQQSDANSRIDYELPLYSLPRLFATRPETIPPPSTTLYVPNPSPAAERVRRLPKPRIGLVWAGNPAHINDATRSVPFGFLHPLIDQTQYAFVSLQKGAGEAELEQIKPSRQVVALAPMLHDMADTAAAILELDLVICVDTAVAHLAGTLGKPTWLMLPYASEWRWLLDADSTAWYPSMRIFRQERRGDWPELAERILAALKTHLFI